VQVNHTIEYFSNLTQEKGKIEVRKLIYKPGSVINSHSSTNFVTKIL